MVKLRPIRALLIDGDDKAFSLSGSQDISGFVINIEIGERYAIAVLSMNTRDVCQELPVLRLAIGLMPL